MHWHGTAFILDGMYCQTLSKLRSCSAESNPSRYGLNFGIINSVSRIMQNTGRVRRWPHYFPRPHNFRNASSIMLSPCSKVQKSGCCTSDDTTAIPRVWAKTQVFPWLNGLIKDIYRTLILTSVMHHQVCYSSCCRSAHKYRSTQAAQLMILPRSLAFKQKTKGSS